VETFDEDGFGSFSGTAEFKLLVVVVVVAVVVGDADGASVVGLEVGPEVGPEARCGRARWLCRRCERRFCRGYASDSNALYRALDTHLRTRF
jgi:hypothetical protein